MLEIIDLVKTYSGPVAALQGVSRDAPRGMFDLLVPNGAGKTTLMRIVAGLLEPTSGTVHFNGEDIVGDPRRIRRQLGYLPQDFGFYPHLTGESMLRFLLVLKRVQAPRGLKHLSAELLSTHIVEDISVLCPRMAIMHEGRLVADTTPAEARGPAGTCPRGRRRRDSRRWSPRC